MNPMTGSYWTNGRVGSRRSLDHACHGNAAFTLVELLLSMAILSVLMLVVVNVIGIVQQQWVRSASRVSEFREARSGFDLMARNLSQATLNTYWMAAEDDLSPDAAGVMVKRATAYQRQSELQFICGETTALLTGAAGMGSSYPGHAVFFQAPLGVTRLVAATGSAVDTENMVNLLCGRGYFVQWGDDAAFRPPFLIGHPAVQPRFRYRLMEYSPTSESNRIYFDPLNPTNLAERRSITLRSGEWFQDAFTSAAAASETTATRAFTRPVAENIVALIISPQLETTANSAIDPTSIAPGYAYNSAQVSSAGAQATTTGQGMQHLLPPLLKLTMVALDSAAGERLAEAGNQGMQQSLAAKLDPLFTNATGYNSPASSTYRRDLESLEQFLVGQKLNFRVFTTTVVMKQARWGR